MLHREVAIFQAWRGWFRKLGSSFFLRRLRVRRGPSRWWNHRVQTPWRPRTCSSVAHERGVSQLVAATTFVVFAPTTNFHLKNVRKFFWNTCQTLDRYSWLLQEKCSSCRSRQMLNMR